MSNPAGSPYIYIYKHTHISLYIYTWIPCFRTAAYRLQREVAAHSKGNVPESIEKRMMPSDHLK